MANKLYSYEEVFKHNKEGDIWVIYKDDVLDLTKFDSHPGGPEVLWELAGRDITQGFEDIGHSSEAVELTKKYTIGKIDPSSPKFAYPTSASSGSADSANLSGLALPILIIVLAVLGYFFL
eukprot:TRINITY_DN4733_c0_g1_i1.p1 TRINITY_DN4733_c0_g1~~TRINITY_DN4733_c0_g1_i1.p1  ORF type:complete len:121 (+),score=29.19 TRINITY_DN4733_c0_g1_i1:279-641(+)